MLLRLTFNEADEAALPDTVDTVLQFPDAGKFQTGAGIAISDALIAAVPCSSQLGLLKIEAAAQEIQPFR